LQFGHQVGLVVQPAGGVDQQYVGTLFAGLDQRVIGQPRGIRPGRPGQHRTAGALAPDLQLLDRGGAKGVAGGKDHVVAGIAALPSVVVLPLPLTPTTRITNGFLSASTRSGRCTRSTSRITSSARAARTSSGETSWLKRVRRNASTTSPATPIPMSLAISKSS